LGNKKNRYKRRIKKHILINIMKFLSVIKYFFLFIFILVFVCCHIDGNTSEKKAIVVKESKLSFQNKIHIFGNLKAGEIVSYSFLFENVGKSSVIIESAKSSCGCITVDFPKYPILPGKTGYIDVEYNSLGDVGKIYKGIILDTTNKQGIRLAIVANVKNEILDINNLKN